MPKRFETVEERRTWERNRKRRQRGRRSGTEMLSRDRSQTVDELKQDQAIMAHPHLRNELLELETVLPTQAELQHRLEQSLLLSGQRSRAPARSSNKIPAAAADRSEGWATLAVELRIAPRRSAVRARLAPSPLSKQVAARARSKRPPKHQPSRVVSRRA
jgi:hypothetical protein